MLEGATCDTSGDVDNCSPDNLVPDADECTVDGDCTSCFRCVVTGVVSNFCAPLCAYETSCTALNPACAG